MTKEELEKEARKDVDSLNGVDLVSSTMVAIDRYGAYKIGRYDGYLAGAEPREKQIADLEDKLANADYQLEGRDNEIAKLEAQIEKMKCCEMCKHKNLNWEFSPICEARDKIKIENPLTCKCDKWEIKEKRQIK